MASSVVQCPRCSGRMVDGRDSLVGTFRECLMCGHVEHQRTRLDEQLAHLTAARGGRPTDAEEEADDELRAS